MKISVNILNWNNLPILKDTVKLLREELLPFEYEIIVVDNGSVDGSYDYLVNQVINNEYYKLRVRRFDKNMGISKGKNAGIELAQGEYILMLDADVYPVRNSVRLMIKYLDEHPECDTIGMKPNKWQTDKIA